MKNSQSNIYENYLMLDFPTIVNRRYTRSPEKINDRATLLCTNYRWQKIITVGFPPTTTVLERVLLRAEEYRTSVKYLFQTYLFPKNFSRNLPIIAFSKIGESEIVESLLSDWRVVPSIKHNLPLRLASRYGHDKTVLTLLQDERVDPSDYGQDALISACENGQIDVLKILLLCPDVIDINGKGYNLAKQNGHKNVCKLLERMGKANGELKNVPPISSFRKYLMILLQRKFNELDLNKVSIANMKRTRSKSQIVEVNEKNKLRISNQKKKRSRVKSTGKKKRKKRSPVRSFSRSPLSSSKRFNDRNVNSDLKGVNGCLFVNKFKGSTQVDISRFGEIV